MKNFLNLRKLVIAMIFCIAGFGCKGFAVQTGLTGKISKSDVMKSTEKTKGVKITILYDNTVFKPGLKSDWGFSCFVETSYGNILFDTGTKGDILLDNMKKSGVDPFSVDEVFISHYHLDHTGGLPGFLSINSKVKIYAPPSFKKIPEGVEIIYLDRPVNLHDNIFSTGELDGIEQSMAVKTERGLVMIVGCSHPEMDHILKAASRFGKIYAIIGGMHGFDDYELFKDIELICPTHCTQHIKEIRSLYPDKCIEGGVGGIIEIK